MKTRFLLFRNYFYGFLLFIIPSIYFGQNNDESALDSAAVKVYSNPDEAIKIAEKVYNKNNDPKLQTTALLLLSNIYSKKMQYDQSLNFALKAKELSFKTNDLKLKLKVLNTVAMHYYISGVYNNALQFLDEAEKVATKYPYKDSIRLVLGNNWGIRGAIYKEQLSPTIALEYFGNAIKEFEKEGNNPKALINLSLIYYNMGYCNITLGKNDLARFDFQKSLEYAEKINSSNIIAYAKQGLAEVYTHEGNYISAINELQNAIKISKNTERDPELDWFIYKSLSDNYLAMNDWDNYQLFSKKYFSAQEDNTTAKRKFIQESLEKSSFENQKSEKDSEWFFYLAIAFISILICMFLYSIIKNQIEFHKKLNNLKEKLPK